MLLGAATGITTGEAVRRPLYALLCALLVRQQLLPCFGRVRPARRSTRTRKRFADQAIRKLDLQSELHRRLLSIDFLANSAIPLRYGRGCIFLRYP